MVPSERSVDEVLSASLSDVTCFLCLSGMKMSFRGTYGLLSLSRLSAMFSNTASIFATVSVFVDRLEGSMGALRLKILGQGRLVQL